jgi:hypothetical protein
MTGIYVNMKEMDIYKAIVDAPLPVHEMVQSSQYMAKHHIHHVCIHRWAIKR